MKPGQLAITRYNTRVFDEGDTFEVVGTRAGFCGCAPELIDIGIPCIGPQRCLECGELDPLPDGRWWVNAYYLEPALTEAEEKEVNKLMTLEPFKWISK